MIDKKQVTDAYELILGRSPEDQRAIEQKLVIETTDELSRELLGSEEFEDRYRRLFQKTVPNTAIKSLPAHMDVETHTDSHILEQLFANTAKAWDSLGNEDAFWSVITDDNFRKEVLPENMQAFEDSSIDDFEMMKRAAAMAGRTINDFEHLIELGCGVGRVTKRAAPHFNKYTAIDVSAPHLKLAQERTPAGAAEFTLIGKPKDLETLPKFDFFFSRIVLQHNPPPVIRYILETVLKKLEPNGIALFQVPTYHPDYTFDTRKHLSNPASMDMEMHIFPQPDVLKIARKNGCDVLSVQQDRDPGEMDLLFVSNTFLLRKRKGIVNKVKSVFA